MYICKNVLLHVSAFERHYQRPPKHVGGDFMYV